MMRRYWIGVFVFAIAGFAAPYAQAQAPNLAAGPELVVGIKEAPPFAMKSTDGEWQGISADLWRRAAAELSLRYRFVEARTANELIEGVAVRKYDVAIGALTITPERERILDFTQPYYVTGLGIAVPAAELASWLPVIHSMTSFGFLQAVLALVSTAGATDDEPIRATARSGRANAIVSQPRWYKISVRSRSLAPFSGSAL